MPDPSVALQVLLPELRLLKTRRGPRGGLDFMVEKTSGHEVCPRCATPSRSVYDHRTVTIRDEPMRRAEIRLLIMPGAELGPGGGISHLRAIWSVSGWINKLPPMRSGEAIPLSEVEVACRVDQQPYRLIPELLPTKDEGWNLAALSEEDVILSYTPPGPSVVSGPNRGW